MLFCFLDQEGIVQKWRNQNLIIHLDNAPAHTSLKVSQFFDQEQHYSNTPSPILTRSGRL